MVLGPSHVVPPTTSSCKEASSLGTGRGVRQVVVGPGRPASVVDVRGGCRASRSLVRGVPLGSSRRSRCRPGYHCVWKERKEKNRDKRSVFMRARKDRRKEHKQPLILVISLNTYIKSFLSINVIEFSLKASMEWLHPPEHIRLGLVAGRARKLLVTCEVEDAVDTLLSILTRHLRNHKDVLMNQDLEYHKFT